MAITYFGSASNPADNLTSAVSPVAITPPGSMVEGDLVCVTLYARNASATFGVSSTGGQTWTAQASHQSSTAVLSAAFYWCRFNGTWSANPAWTFSSTTNTNAVMHVFRPTGALYTWAIDPYTSPGVGGSDSNALNSYTAPSALPNIFTGTPTNDSTVTLFICTSDDDNTWARNPTTTGSAQYRNTSGSDASSAFGHYILTTSTALGSGQFQQVTNGGDPGIKGSFTFYEIAPTPRNNALVTYYASAKNTGVAGTPTFNYQGTPVAGDLFLLVVASKYPANTLGTLPSGYTFIGSVSGGPAGTGADVGAVLISVYTKEATGSEGGTSIQINNPGSTGIVGTLWQFHKPESIDTWDTVIYTNAAVNAGTASLSFASPSVIDLEANDAFLGVLGLNTDLYTYSSLSLTTPGLTTTTADAAASRVTAAGDDLAIIENLLAITGGEPTNVPVFSATASGSTANNPAGAGIFIRISATNVVVSTTKFLMLMGVGP